MLPVSGCSVAGLGTNFTRVTTTETAKVVEVHSFGLQIRTDRSDPGTSLGYRCASYVYPRTLMDAPVGTAIQPFIVPREPANPVLIAIRTFGGELQAVSHSPRFTIGFLNQFQTAIPLDGVSRNINLRFNRQSPESTFLRYIDDTTEGFSWPDQQ